MATADLYYDKRLICHLSELEFDGPNIHAQSIFAYDKGDEEWLKRIEEYIAITHKAHELEQEKKHQQATQHQVDHYNFLNKFGKHLWYIKYQEDGRVTKIRPPFFGLDNYARIFLSRDTRYDRELVEQRLKVRMSLLQAALAGFTDKMDAEEIADHLRALSFCSTLIVQIAKPESNVLKIVDQWFERIENLQSPVPLFNDEAERRMLDQTCAEDGNKAMRFIP